MRWQLAAVTVAALLYVTALAEPFGWELPLGLLVVGFPVLFAASLVRALYYLLRPGTPGTATWAGPVATLSGIMLALSTLVSVASWWLVHGDWWDRF